MALPPIADADVLVATRNAWHCVAEHALAPARYAAVGRIGLRVVPGGFGTPPFPRDGVTHSAQVVGDELHVHRDDAEVVARVTTVGDVAQALEIIPGAPSTVYTPTTPLDPGALLPIDLDAARVLAAWFELGWSVLEDLGRIEGTPAAPSEITLWPEHFDAAIELGDETRGARGSFGASPGDAEHPEPYLYVTHWADVPSDPYWNSAVFAGASLPYSEVALSEHPRDIALEFFRTGVARLNGSAA